MGINNNEVIMVIKLVVIGMFLVFIVGLVTHIMKLLFDREE